MPREVMKIYCDTENRVKKTTAKPASIGKIWKEPRDGLSPMLWKSWEYVSNLAKVSFWVRILN